VHAQAEIEQALAHSIKTCSGRGAYRQDGRALLIEKCALQISQSIQ
jgi:hypothetical protein